jgi:uncharacterized protein (TIGR02001 family)
MKLIRGAALTTGLLLVAGAAQAGVSSTVTIVSDYDFRGFSQSGSDPALQVSLDYAADSGWYAGVWGSNIDDFLDYDGSGVAETEIDLYTGYSKSFDNGWGYDVGITYYTYSGASDLNYFEVYGKVSYQWLTGSLYWSDDFAGFDNAVLSPGVKSGSAYYVALDASIPAGPLTVDLHAGLSGGDGIEPLFDGVEDSYTDYSIGVSYTANNFTTGLKWVAYDADRAGSDDRFLLSFSTTLPWGE